MYEIKAEDTFIQDVNRWSKKVTEYGMKFKQ